MSLKRSPKQERELEARARANKLKEGLLPKATKEALREIKTERSAAQLAATRRGMGPRKK